MGQQLCEVEDGEVGQEEWFEMDIYKYHSLLTRNAFR